ncbi:MAG: hypothetical protein P1U40_10355 [Coxiellaceae bacterium]|nr:hypothetical protein [Coxiellaceae bacterium]
MRRQKVTSRGVVAGSDKDSLKANIDKIFDDFLQVYSIQSGEDFSHHMSSYPVKKIRSRSLPPSFHSARGEFSPRWVLNNSVSAGSRMLTIRLGEVKRNASSERGAILASGGYGNIRKIGGCVEKEYTHVRHVMEVKAAIQEFIIFLIIHGESFPGEYQLSIVFEKSLRLRFTLPEIPGTTFARFVRDVRPSRAGGVINSRDTFSMLFCLTKNIKWLDRLGYAYRDFQDANIMGSSNVWFLVDFGILESSSDHDQLRLLYSYIKRVLSAEHMRWFSDSSKLSYPRDFVQLADFFESCVAKCNALLTAELGLESFFDIPEHDAVRRLPQASHAHRGVLPRGVKSPEIRPQGLARSALFASRGEVEAKSEPKPIFPWKGAGRAK